MPSENYRYYCLDGTGRLHDAAWFYAESDENAIKLIEARHPDSKCEIWLGKRLVAFFLAGIDFQSMTHQSFRLSRVTESLLCSGEIIEDNGPERRLG